MSGDELDLRPFQGETQVDLEVRTFIYFLRVREGNVFGCIRLSP